ncbi:helix-turn-helix transcriptional regulator [Jeotgalibacillus sp. ET6]|uniref:helix-turn-helix domain-containing protein n=1 Tax=Jeotgalibacillus sp. ET6 TaxID=3037260 RepID=UPI002418AD86|nr:helix-turn-helix transcriptional regulator [Jeotgalibacillus sp. ET6]MDG5473672.1 helix-turn-helix transcriptional regulator [Jeotgalibacillus sp. ET6]
MSCFGENLKRVREEKSMTIEELALKARLGVKTLENYEKNIQLPASQTILKLLTVLDVPASALLEKRNNSQLSQ